MTAFGRLRDHGALDMLQTSPLRWVFVVDGRPAGMVYDSRIMAKVVGWILGCKLRYRRGQARMAGYAIGFRKEMRC